MRYYFNLQFSMINRQLAGFGINPAAGYILGIAAFTGFSLLLFNKTEFAVYIYLITALSLVTRLSETRRNDFLKTCFPGPHYYNTRIAENIIVVLPFAVFMLSKMMFLQSLILFALASLLALVSFTGKTSFTVPTPFGKRPFEFTTGFRNTFPLIFFAYFLAVMAVWVGNFNLGIFSLLLVFFTCITYYLNPENEFYVWIYNLSPGRFIISKIRTALLYSTLLSVPAAIFLLFFFRDEWLIITGFQALGYIYLSVMVLAKYSSYPSQVNLPQVLIMALTVWFPPALLAVAPYFYIQSVKRLKEIL
jgi:hypothetical protein